MANLPMVVKNMAKGESAAGKAAKKVRRKLNIKVNPRLAELGIGVVGGATIGGLQGKNTKYKYNKETHKADRVSDEQRKKNAIKGTIVGSIAGGLGAGALGHASLLGVKGAEKAVNKGSDTVQEAYNNIYNGIVNNPSMIKTDKGLAEEALYKKMYEAKQGKRQAMSDIKKMEDRNARMRGTQSMFGNSRSRKGMRPVTNRYENNINDAIKSDRGVAEGVANEMAKDKFFKEHIEGGSKRYNIHSSAKRKIFGGLRATKDLGNAAADIGMRGKKYNDIISDLRDQEFAKTLGRMTGKSKHGYDFHKVRGMEVDVNEARNSKAYKDRVSEIKRGAFKDAKKNQKFKFFDGETQQNSKNGFKAMSDKEIKGFANKLGFDPSEIKTKAELNSKYKKLAMQYHPDRNPGNKEAEEKFKQINEAMNNIRESQWFNKLALEEYKEGIYKIAFER